jgi:hypothetical protein
VNKSFIISATLADPIGTVGTDPAHFGPNFTFNPANAVPVPLGASAGMVLMSGVGTGKAWRRIRGAATPELA